MLAADPTVHGSSIYDCLSPNHKGPNTVHMIRLQVADLICRSGYRRVLDLPSGTGALAKVLLDKGLDVVMADLYPETLRVPGQSCVKADLNTVLPFESNQFDAFVCIEGVEHIENPHLLAREAYRILRPGGQFYVTTPNILSIRSRLSYLFRGYPNQFHYMIEVDAATSTERPIDHINPIGFLELRYVLHQAGLAVDLVQTNRFYKTRSPLYRFIRFLMKLRGRRSAGTHPQVARVRDILLSDALLFGEGLIVGATKPRAS